MDCDDRDAPISQLYQYSIPAWRNTTVEIVEKLSNKNPGALVKRDGDYGYYPLFYAMYYNANLSVINYIVKEMVETYQYPSEWRNNLKKGMIHSLYESSHCWKRTSIKHIQLIVNQDVKVLVKKNVFGTIPLFYAIKNGAKLEVLIWLCEQTGIDVVKKWRSDGWTDVRSNTEATFLHVAAWYKHSHMIPYLLTIFPEAIDIKSNYDFTPLDWAKKWKFPTIYDLLIKPEATRKEYKENRKKLIHNYELVMQIPSLHDHTDKWKRTTLSHVKNLVLIENNKDNFDVNGMPIFDDKKFRNGILEAKDDKGYLPISYAINHGAKLEVIVWMVSIIGIDMLTSWRGSMNECHLHYAAYNQPHLLPYMLSLFGTSGLEIIDDHLDETPLQWADKKQNVDCLLFLKDVPKTIEEFDAKYTGGAINLQADQVESFEIESLHEFSDRWQKTGVLTVENLEKKNVGTLITEDEDKYLPIIYAGWNGAPLNTFKWMCEHTLLLRGSSMYKSAEEKNLIKQWRDSSDWTILHYIVFFNHSHLIPYVLYLFPNAVKMIDDNYHKTPLEYAQLQYEKELQKQKEEEENRAKSRVNSFESADEKYEKEQIIKRYKASINYLTNPNQAVEEYCYKNGIDYEEHVETIEEENNRRESKEKIRLWKLKLKREKEEQSGRITSCP